MSNLISFHENIKYKLKCFIEQNKIPHILFHGPSGSGKRTLVYKFVSDIYNNDKEIIKNYTLFTDCAHVKGIKFIRDDLKFFAKTNINTHGMGFFKSIVLTNADKLTTDAQSALRRCIELFSHNTRFFIVVENKYNLLKPILSRLCEIYIDSPMIVTSEGIYTSFNTYNISKLLNTNDIEKRRETWLINEFKKINQEPISNKIIINLVNKLYEKGYSGLDLMTFIENEPIKYEPIKYEPINEETDTTKELHKYKLLMVCNKVKKEFRSEKMFMTFILNFYFVRSNSDLENILSM